MSLKAGIPGIAGTAAGTEVKCCLTSCTMRPSETKHLKVSAASKYLGLSPNTLRRCTDLGLIRAKRLPGGDRLYKREWLDQFVDGLEDAAPRAYNKPQSDLSRNPREGGC